jgi:hypothetical protein
MHKDNMTINVRKLTYHFCKGGDVVAAQSIRLLDLFGFSLSFQWFKPTPNIMLCSKFIYVITTGVNFTEL